jgi:uncharacterized protein DUF6048
MRRTFVYIISLFPFLFCSIIKVNAQDTISIPLKIKIGLEVSGPAIYLSEKNTFSAEGYISADLNEKIAPVLGAGYIDYKYSQYNYEYKNKGYFLRTGADFNLLKPEKAIGKYWAGIGLRYGISRFNFEIPSIQHDNYWGPNTFSIPQTTNWAHFIEASPGVRAEVFNNFSIGWTVSIRMLLYSGAGDDLRPIYIPGFGNGEKSFSTGISYFMVWNIPYKKRRVIIPIEEPEEPDEEDNMNPQENNGFR